MAEWVTLHRVTGQTCIVDLAGALIEPIPPEEADRPGNCWVYRQGEPSGNFLGALEVLETLEDFERLLGPATSSAEPGTP